MATRAEAKFARLRPLADTSSGDFAAVLEIVAQQCHKAGVKGKLQVHLLTGEDRWQTSAVLLTADRAEVRAEAIDAPDFEILTDHETWNAIIEGKLSPIEAMAKRRMRVRGNMQYGSALMKRMAGSEGRTEICRPE